VTYPPPEYLSMSRTLLEDFRRFSANKMKEKIVETLQEQLDKNKTRTMTFTENGLELAIKIIEEIKYEA
jgi:hypothetical protein